MPYFAYVQDSVVNRVERIEKYVMQDQDGNEVEALGQRYLASIYPGTIPADFIQCWYPVGQPDPYPRGKYPGGGDIWDGSVFYTPGQG